ncbi:MAG: CPBP family intramembrane metalloprotease [Actinomycetia bacterium]|nr:CPBP family intramembrane metalloprotease [Actinomycetes bacterium]
MNSNRAQISIRGAGLAYLGAWFVGNLAAGAVLSASGKDSVAEAGHGWLLGISLAQWLPILVALWLVGRRAGTGSFATDYGLSFRPIDLVGIPIGVVTQVALVPLLYVPLERMWPATFGDDDIEKRARELYGNPSTLGLALLILVAVVGAPLVEELLYRGLLQGALGRTLTQWRGWLALVLVAALFALVHFSPVEYPGLFLIGLVLGVCALRTGRLGLGIVTHAAFNATALVLVARS